jgi:hypothetical protein
MPEGKHSGRSLGAELRGASRPESRHNVFLVSHR